MDKPAIGFMSYVRLDDEHENGRLSELRKRLEGELRMQSGETFPVFQDRNDIGWGQHWKERIENGIDGAVFLFPIITPGFFKSPPCRDELQRFLDREQQLSRNDLIFPVYYIQCAVLQDEEKRAQDPLAQVLSNRQYVDWREQRFEHFTSPQIGRLVANMAKQILAALERPRPTLISATPAARPTDATDGTAVRQEERTTTEQAAETPRPAANLTEPPCLVVDALHRGDHTSLSAAITAASPGTRILVRPGLYREGLVIDKPIEIIGDGSPGEIVVEAAGTNTVLFKASMGRIANLTLRQVGEGKFFCVDICQGRLDIEDCDISSQSLACIAIRDGADPLVRRNQIHDGKQSGVFVFDNGQGVIEDNEIFANTTGGVSIKTGGNPTLRRNRIHDGKGSGIHIYDNGQGVIEDNEIFANAYAGVEIKTGGNPTLRRNRIHDGKTVGINIHDNGQGVVEDNDIFANAFSGIQIKTGGNPILRRNRIHDGDSTGIHVYDNGQSIVEDNEIFANTNAGVAIKTGGNPTLRRNRITDNGYEAVWIFEGGGGVFEDNDLRGNERGAWDIAPDCLDKLKRSNNLE